VGTAATLWLFSKRANGAPLPALLRVLSWVGAFSYSLYLIHLAVLSPLTNLLRRFMAPTELRFCVAWLGAVALSGLAGWVVYRCVEAPIERWRKSRWSARPAAKLSTA
jgi:peptidoglycan/LPS O-acetylase OafA/YrhL